MLFSIKRAGQCTCSLAQVKGSKREEKEVCSFSVGESRGLLDFDINLSIENCDDGFARD